MSPRSGVTVLLRSITADVGELLPRAPPRSVYTLGLATRTKRVKISPARGVMVPLFEVAGQIGASYFGGKLAVCSANLGARDRLTKTKKSKKKKKKKKGNNKKKNEGEEEN